MESQLGAGYDFLYHLGYNDNQPDKSESTGKAAVENYHKLIAVFPRKEAKTFNDLATFFYAGDIYSD